MLLALAAVTTSVVLIRTAGPQAPDATAALPPVTTPSDAAPGGSAPPVPTAGRAAGPTSGSPADSLAAAVSAATGAAAAAGGTLHVAIGNAGGLLAASGANAPAYTASLVKLFVVAELLERSSSGRVSLSATDRDRMHRAIARSDDQAMNSLWVDHDGPALVQAAIEEFGLTGSAGTRMPGQWGQVRTTAADLVTFLAGLDRHLGAADASTLRAWMRSAPATAADGFDQAYGLLSPAVAPPGTVAVKQGWMCCVAGRLDLHSLGMLPDGTVVVLLGTFPEDVSWSTARAALDAAAADVVRALRQPGAEGALRNG